MRGKGHSVLTTPYSQQPERWLDSQKAGVYGWALNERTQIFSKQAVADVATLQQHHENLLRYKTEVLRLRLPPDENGSSNLGLESLGRFLTGAVRGGLLL